MKTCLSDRWSGTESADAGSDSGGVGKCGEVRSPCLCLYCLPDRNSVAIQSHISACLLYSEHVCCVECRCSVKTGFVQSWSFWLTAKNKKKSNDKTKSSTDGTDVNGAHDDPEDDADEDETASRKQSVAGLDDSTTPQPLPLNVTNDTSDLAVAPKDPHTDGHAQSETAARLDAMVQERDSLRQELAELRKSLESTKETESLRSQAEVDKTTKHNAELGELRKSIQDIQDKHQQELDTLSKQAKDAQATKDNAAVAELRASIESMQQNHQQEIQDLKDQAQHAQSQQDNAEVANLRQSISSMQEKHTIEIQDLQKQAEAAQTTKDNLEIAELRQSLESRTAEYQKQVEHLTKGAHEAHSKKESAEIAELRNSLESLRDEHQKEVEELKRQVQQAQAEKQSSDGEDLEQLRKQLEEAIKDKEKSQADYRSLLGKVNTIRSQLGERLKADAEELSKARAEIEDLQEETKSARESKEELQATIDQLETQRKEHESEIESLRSRTNVSQSNWVKERDELITREAYAREEFENARQAMQDWEVLAMEERSLRESLSERVAEIEEQLNAQREAYDRAASERDTQNSTVDSLQRALQEIQEARKKELREMVETSQAQLDALRAQTEEAKTSAAASAEELEKTRKELEHALPFEKEVKEKNLLIGKLRHEAVILNDHLTKALRFLKRGKPEDNVDRHIVTNHFLHFLMLDRSDPKKFQILQLIAALLGWTEGMSLFA
jgi:chromosome segregation ATPase